MLILNRQAVEQLLDLDQLIDALAPGMVALSAGELSMPPRIAALVPDHDGLLANMPVYLPGAGVLSTKLVSVYYRLILNEAGQPVGEVNFHRLDRRTMMAELNVKVIHTERGKGYGSAALRQLLDHFFNEFGGRMMLDDVALDNHLGQQVLLRFGFEHDRRETGEFRLRMTHGRYQALYGK